MRKLIVFDTDGVLIKGKFGGFKDILVILGKEKEVRKIDEEYQKRKHSGPWGLEELAKLYRGFSQARLRKVAKQYCLKTLQDGIQKYLKELKEKSHLIGTLTSNPQFIVDNLIEILKLDFGMGTKLEFKNNIATGKIIQKVDRYKKAEILKEKIQFYKIKKENVIVVGDSITDLPMAEAAGIFIAFQPKEKTVREKAKNTVEEIEQLRKIL